MKLPRFALSCLRMLLLLCLAMPSFASQELDSVDLRNLPPEAAHTLQLIKQGGPFPYPRDGIVFGNFEKRLPLKSRGYYHEYTVPTPGAKTRGARRIIAGQGIHQDVRSSGEYYYSDDHYRSFKRIKQ